MIKCYSKKMNKTFFPFLTFCALLPLLITLTIVPYGYGQQESAKEAEALFVAKKAIDDGFYDVALSLLERFLKNYPLTENSAEVNLLIGECYFHQNKYLDALSKFNELLAQPSAKKIEDAIRYWIAEVHFRGNDFSKAATFYRSIIDKFPKSSYLASAYYSLGWCLFQEQQWKESLEFFSLVEKQFPKESGNQDVYFKIIECLYNLKDYAALQEKLTLYLKRYSKDNAKIAYLYFYSAEADYYLNNFKEAVDTYSKVLAKTDDEKMVGLSKLGMGWSFLRLKQYKQAEEIFQEIKKESLDKKSSDVLLLGKGILCFETKKFKEAQTNYEELIRTTQDPVVLIQAYLGKADALYNLEAYKEAYAWYKEALVKAEAESLPGDLLDKLHYGLAWTSFKLGEFKDAIREFQKIAKQSEDKIVKISALCQIGDAYQDSGDYAKALETYDDILKGYPDSLYSDYVQYQLGLTMLKAANYEGAIVSFLTLKKNFPQSKLLDDAMYALGLAYFQKQDYQSSKEVCVLFENEFKTSNLAPQALYLLGSSLYNMGKFSEAIEVFRLCVRLYSQDTELCMKAEYEIADCYYQLGDEKEAMARFKQLRTKYPNASLSAEIIWWLGEYYYRQNDYVLASRYFSSLISDFPKSGLVVDAYYILGSIADQESKYKEALEYFGKVLEQERTDLAGQAAIAVADIYAKQGKPEQALSTYQDILNKYPNLTNVLYQKIADLFIKKKQYIEAIQFYRKSLDVAPNKERPSLQFKIAETKQTQGNTREAIEEYLKVTYLYPESTDIAVKALLRIAQIYENNDNPKDAMIIYKKITAMNVAEAKYAQERIDWLKEKQ